eukprot:CAMPEP_0201878252 /NCGR_PEP_ID=MMETSP0902-20130614/9465_1 /ASSEMBLY_ACC=CAM_ASM_000551 /TAXON_ID=420261 /ORGANISM="Thalassiosira antarctica, Strain CCMP982" /LENGTH=311 /DNA_ID=CAMNT_0048405869 /DNA_START=133 /DNA_END=1069 /DNA_ORIENTATION=-
MSSNDKRWSYNDVLANRTSNILSDYQDFVTGIGEEAEDAVTEILNEGVADTAATTANALERGESLSLPSSTPQYHDEPQISKYRDDPNSSFNGEGDTIQLQRDQNMIRSARARFNQRSSRSKFLVWMAVCFIAALIVGGIVYGKNESENTGKLGVSDELGGNLETQEGGRDDENGENLANKPNEKLSTKVCQDDPTYTFPNHENWKSCAHWVAIHVPNATHDNAALLETRCSLATGDKDANGLGLQVKNLCKKSCGLCDGDDRVEAEESQDPYAQVSGRLRFGQRNEEIIEEVQNQYVENENQEDNEGGSD